MEASVQSEPGRPLCVTCTTYSMNGALRTATQQLTNPPHDMDFTFLKNHCGSNGSLATTCPSSLRNSCCSQKYISALPPVHGRSVCRRRWRTYHLEAILYVINIPNEVKPLVQTLKVLNCLDVSIFRVFSRRSCLRSFGVFAANFPAPRRSSLRPASSD